jgi:corin
VLPEESKPPDLKQMPPSIVSQQHKPLQPPIPPPHISDPPKPQQAVKNINSEVAIKQKPLKPRLLPTVPPQSHSLQQQPQVQSNKQQECGTLKMEQPQCYAEQSPSFQTQIQQTQNISQTQQTISQPQNQVEPSQTLNQAQTQQPANKSQSQNSQLCNQEPNFPTSQQPQKTQEAQIQQQPIAMPPSKVEQQPYDNNKVSVRQDSNVSSDSFSQTSSPSYTTKTMETLLLSPHGASSTKASKKVTSGNNNKILNGDIGNGAPLTGNNVSSNGNSALTKSVSTPASLQATVRFHHGSNMSLHHRVSMTQARGQ